MLNRVSFNIPKFGYSIKSNQNKISMNKTQPLKQDSFELSFSGKDKYRQKTNFMRVNSEEAFRLKLFKSLEEGEKALKNGTSDLELWDELDPEANRRHMLLEMFDGAKDINELNERRETALKMSKVAFPFAVKYFEKPITEQEYCKLNDEFQDTIKYYKECDNCELKEMSNISKFEDSLKNNNNPSIEEFEKIFPVMKEINVLYGQMSVEDWDTLNNIYKNYIGLKEVINEKEPALDERILIYNSFANDFEYLGDDLNSSNLDKLIVSDCYRASKSMLEFNKMLEEHSTDNALTDEHKAILEEEKTRQIAHIDNKIETLNKKIENSKY